MLGWFILGVVAVVLVFGYFRMPILWWTLAGGLLAGPVEELCAMCDDWEITHERYDLPPQVWQFIKDQGFLGMIIPKKYGGMGFSALAHSAVITKLSSRSNAVSVSVMVPNSLGPA